MKNGSELRKPLNEGGRQGRDWIQWGADEGREGGGIPIPPFSLLITDNTETHTRTHTT